MAKPHVPLEETPPRALARFPSSSSVLSSPSSLSPPTETLCGLSSYSILRSLLHMIDSMVCDSHVVPSALEPYVMPANRRFKLSVSEYVARFVRKTDLHVSVVVHFAVLLSRFTTKFKVTLTHNTAHRVCLALLVVASKAVSDTFGYNSAYARIGAVPLPDMNAMEAAVLCALDWCVAVSPHEWHDMVAGLVVQLHAATNPAIARTQDRRGGTRATADAADDAVLSLSSALPNSFNSGLLRTPTPPRTKPPMHVPRSAHVSRTPQLTSRTLDGRGSTSLRLSMTACNIPLHPATARSSPQSAYAPSTQSQRALSSPSSVSPGSIELSPFLTRNRFAVGAPLNVARTNSMRSNSSEPGGAAPRSMSFFGHKKPDV